MIFLTAIPACYGMLIEKYIPEGIEASPTGFSERCCTYHLETKNKI